MNKTEVVNVRLVRDCFRVCRGTPFGNPYSSKPSKFNTLKVSSAAEAVRLYKVWLTTDLEIPGWPKPTLEEIKNLRGKKLGCYCAPEEGLEYRRS